MLDRSAEGLRRFSPGQTYMDDQGRPWSVIAVGLCDSFFCNGECLTLSPHGWDRKDGPPKRPAVYQVAQFTWRRVP